MKLNIAVCDDEKIICDEIQRLLQSMKPDSDIDVYYSGRDLLMSNKIYDIIILDIEMPRLDGFRTAKLLRKHQINSYVIYLTGYPNRMPEAFKVKAFRFLCKPVKPDELEEAVTSAEQEIIDYVKISVTLHGHTHVAAVKDILYFEAFGDGTYIHTISGEVLESNKPLKYWMSKVGSKHFYQAHKSYFIAFRYVKDIETKYVELQPIEERIPLSRRQHIIFKQKFFDYMDMYARYQ